MITDSPEVKAFMRRHFADWLATVDAVSLSRTGKPWDGEMCPGEYLTQDACYTQYCRWRRHV